MTNLEIFFSLGIVIGLIAIVLLRRHDKKPHTHH